MSKPIYVIVESSCGYKSYPVRYVDTLEEAVNYCARINWVLRDSYSDSFFYYIPLSNNSGPDDLPGSEEVPGTYRYRGRFMWTKRGWNMYENPLQEPDFVRKVEHPVHSIAIYHGDIDRRRCYVEVTIWREWLDLKRAVREMRALACEEARQNDGGFGDEQEAT